MQDAKARAIAHDYRETTGRAERRELWAAAWKLAERADLDHQETWELTGELAMLVARRLYEDQARRRAVIAAAAEADQTTAAEHRAQPQEAAGSALLPG